MKKAIFKFKKVFTHVVGSEYEEVVELDGPNTYSCYLIDKLIDRYERTFGLEETVEELYQIKSELKNKTFNREVFIEFGEFTFEISKIEE